MSWRGTFLPPPLCRLLEVSMNVVVRKLSMLKNSIDQKEVVVNSSGGSFGISEQRLKIGVNELFDKLVRKQLVLEPALSKIYIR